MKTKRAMFIASGLLCGVLLIVAALALLAPKAVSASITQPFTSKTITAVSALPIVDDFQAGVPAAWFTYGDWGNGAVYNLSTILTNSLTAATLVSDTVLKVDYNVAGWGVGGGKDLAPDDWSAYDGLSFWFYGANTGNTFRIVLSDNKSGPGDTAERFATTFVNDFTGWKHFVLPWEVFYRDGWQPGGAPNDGLTLTEMWAYAVIPASGGGTFYLDQVKLFKTAGPTVDDFQTGAANWFTYGDWGNGAVYDLSTILTNSLTAPTLVSDTVLKVDYNVAGWGVGGGKDLPPADWSAYDGLSFWFYGANTGNTFRIVLSDNKSGPGDTAERFATTFVDDFTGWKHFILPWEVFYRDGWQPGGAPNDGLTLTEMWAYAVIPASGGGTFYLDQVKLFKTAGPTVDDFQTGAANWFTYGDWGNGAVYDLSTVLTNSLTAPALVSDTVLQVDYNVAGWGVGGGKDLPPADWSAYDGLSFWFYGANTGNTFRIVLSDNKSGPGDTAERFATTFVNDFTGWKHFVLPWEVFYRDGWQPGGAPNDGLTLTEMWAYAVIPASGSGAFYLDQVKLYSDNVAGGASQPTASLSAATYSVDEGATALITVTLNITSTLPITVSYIMTDGTAIAGVDYLDTSGDLVFSPGDLTQAFTVTTIDNSVYGGDKTVLLSIADPINAALGYPRQAVLTIVDNEQSPQPPIAPENIWVLDNFENGLPTGTDEYGNPVGFVTWGSAANTFISTLPVTETNPLALPIWLDNNHLLQVDYDIASGGYGGFSRLFTNAAVDTWLSMDWTPYLGVSFWVYGTGSGGEINFDIFDNKTTTGDSCERFTYIFPDNFTGWKYFEVLFTDFVRKGYQPPGAPNDGLTLTEVWGYAFGFPAGVNARTNYIENTGLMMRTAVVDDFAAGVPTGMDGFGNTIGFMTWGSAVNTFITTTQVVSTSPLAFPLPLGGNNFLQVDYNIAAGGWGGFTHLFTNEAVDTWVSQNWVTYEGVSFWVYGTGSGGDINIDIFDNKTTTGDSCERWTYIFPDNFTGWRFFPIAFSDFTRKGWQPGGAPNDGLTLTEVWGYAFGFPAAVEARTNYLELVTTYGTTTPPYVEPTVSFGEMGYNVIEGDLLSVTVKLNVVLTYPVSVDYATSGGTATPDRDYLPVSGTFTFAPGETEHTFGVQTLDDRKYEGNETVGLELSGPVSITLGTVNQVNLTILDNDPFDPLMIDDFETFPYGFEVWGGIKLTNLEVVTGTTMALPGQWTYENVLEVSSADDKLGFTPAGAGFSRTFFESKDWSGASGLGFWYYGQNSGEAVTVTVQDNRQPDPGPSGWTLVWSDEFDGGGGSPINPAYWTHEIGGQGWGNAEWEYYTDSTENSSLDGSSNLVITAREVATDTTPLDCWYGPCTHTSARLVTANKFEFAYGRAEARLKVPFGQGIWPAFWSLGNNFNSAGWPNCGELDIMENIGREPNIVHGTIHGPGYSGGSGIGGGYTLPEGNFSDDFHIFAIEWEPTEIRWYVDGTQYLTTTINDIPTGTEWVFNHPFFLILNVAVGGYWPGYPDDSTIFPQTMMVDYVRVYQGPDTAERFDALFTDNFSGWKKVKLPFTAFNRSAQQPEGAPDDGLGLTQVWGYGFGLPAGVNLPVYLDQVSLFEGAVAQPTVQFTSDAYAVDEGGTATITVTLDASSSTPVTVTFTTADGTAIAGSDYLTSTGTLVFAPGEVSKTFQVVTLADTAQEGDETVVLTLSDPQGVELGPINEAILTIRDQIISLIKLYFPVIYKQP